MQEDFNKFHAVQYAGCLYWLILPGAIVSLFIDALVWSIAHYDPISMWSLIMAVLTLANLSSLFVPFVAHRMLVRRRIIELNPTPYLVIMLLFWVLNLYVAYEAWFGLCPGCYFG